MIVAMNALTDNSHVINRFIHQAKKNWTNILQCEPVFQLIKLIGKDVIRFDVI